MRIAVTATYRSGREELRKFRSRTCAEIKRYVLEINRMKQAGIVLHYRIEEIK